MSALRLFARTARIPVHTAFSAPPRPSSRVSAPAQLPGLLLTLALALALAACAPKVKLFQDASEPLMECLLEGEGQGKVAVIPVSGVISDEAAKGWFGSRPSMVQEVVSQLNLAAEDTQIKAVVLKIDSPGGTTTASDILYHEITRFKEKSKAKVVAAMMDVAASGGYYTALSADRILAHPPTITGSVGVIFMRPKAYGLMDKIGISMEVSKSGANKDGGSPFREETAEEKAIFDAITKSEAERFLGLVRERRHPSEEAMAEIATARIFDAQRAKALGLVDAVGYLGDALKEARTLAGLPDNAQVVAFRRTPPANDNLYNSATSREGTPTPLVSLGLESFLAAPKAGFYYLWLP
jgi:protease-4